MLIMLAILAWIGLGALGLQWLVACARPEQADTFFSIGLVVSCGAPLVLMALVGG